MQDANLEMYAGLSVNELRLRLSNQERATMLYVALADARLSEIHRLQEQLLAGSEQISLQALYNRGQFRLRRII